MNLRGLGDSAEALARKLGSGLKEGGRDVVADIAQGPKAIVTAATGCYLGAKAGLSVPVYDGNRAYFSPKKAAFGCTVGGYGGWTMATSNGYSFTQGFRRGWNSSD